jgi:DNA primase
LRSKFYAARRPARGGPPAARPIPRPPASANATTAERARILTAILLRHPALLADVDHAYAVLELPPSMAVLRDAVRNWVETAEILDSQALIDHLTISGLQSSVAQVLAAVPVPLPACAASMAMPAEALEGWWHIFGFLNLERLRDEVTAAERDFARDCSAEMQRRHIALKDALNKVMAGEPDGAELAA